MFRARLQQGRRPVRRLGVVGWRVEYFAGIRCHDLRQCSRPIASLVWRQIKFGDCKAFICRLQRVVLLISARSDSTQKR